MINLMCLRNGGKAELSYYKGQIRFVEIKADKVDYCEKFSIVKGKSKQVSRFRGKNNKLEKFSLFILFNAGKNLSKFGLLKEETKDERGRKESGRMNVRGGGEREGRTETNNI